MSLFDTVKKKYKKEVKVRQSDQRRIDVSRFLTPYRQKILINIFALLIISGTIALLTDRFLTVKNITNVLRNLAPVIIVRSAFTPLMVSRMFDLSVGSVVGKILTFKIKIRGIKNVLVLLKLFEYDEEPTTPT